MFTKIPFKLLSSTLKKKPKNTLLLTYKFPNSNSAPTIRTVIAPDPSISLQRSIENLI